MRPDIIFYFHCRTCHLVDLISVEESIGQLYVSIEPFTSCRASGKFGTNDKQTFLAKLEYACPLLVHVMLNLFS